MTNVTATPAASVRDTLLKDAASAFRITDSSRVTRGRILHSLKADGMTEPQVSAALGKVIGADAPSRATVGFYVRTYDLYLAADVTTPALFTLLWSVVTRGKGITDEDVRAVIVTGDAKATTAAVKALVAERKEITEQAKAAERIEAKANEAAAEAGAMAAPAIAGTDFSALVAAIVAKAGTTEARKRAAAALAQGIEALNEAERASRASRVYVA